MVALALRVAATDDSRAVLTLSQSRQELTVVDALRGGENELANDRFAVFFESVASSGGAIDPNALVQEVLRESYLQTTEDLRFFAEKVRYFNEQKKALRSELTRLEELRSASEGTATRDAISAMIADLEEKLNSVGDDAQLANVDLQNILQKQQQTLQIMSNISKMLFDTAQSVIRKIGG
jgi:hypothetical protein